MYAVIMTGGKQYRVSQGDKVRVEKLDAAEGEGLSTIDIAFERTATISKSVRRFWMAAR